jgi:hypothetical protein
MSRSALREWAAISRPAPAGHSTPARIVTAGLPVGAPGGSTAGSPFTRTAAVGEAGPLAATQGDTARSDILITAGGPVRLDNGDAAGAIRLSSSQAISSAELLKAAGDIDLIGATGVQARRVDAGGRATFAAINGAVLVSEDLRSVQAVDAAGRSVALTATGPLAVRSASASAGNVALVSGGALTVQSADASGDVAASSGGLLALGGAINGSTLSFSSRDIQIGQQAQIGSAARTASIQITANGGTAPIVIGGSGQGGGFRLDNAEFSRITTRDLRISGQGENATMQVEGLNLRGAGSGTSFNVRDTLTLASTGDVSITGKLAIENAGDGNVVRVSSSRGVFADTAGGGISITNGSGALTGRVELEGRQVVVASQAALADLQSAPDAEARSERLSRNDGAIDNGGFIRAGAIRLSAAERIIVQNSGDGSSRNPDDRAGLNAGSGGITLASRGASPVEVIINGRQNGGQPGAVLGKDLVAAIRTEGQQGGNFQFAPGSTVNGCLVTGAPCGVFFTPANDPVAMSAQTIQSLEEDEEEAAEEGLTRPPAIGFSRLISLEGSPFLPVIDEPVTGSGNEDLAIDALIPGNIGTDGLPREDQLDGPVTGSGNEALQSPDTPLIQLQEGGTGSQQPDANGPATGTGNDDLQNGDGADGPVTGTGNEDLQNRPGR